MRLFRHALLSKLLALTMGALLLSLASGLAEPPAGQAGKEAAEKPKVDAYGDPLPPGAIARLGTLRMRHQGHVSGVAFSRDGRLIASCGHDGTLRLWDSADGKEIRRLANYGSPIHGVAFSPDGKTVASVGHFKGERNSSYVRLWDAETGKPMGELELAGSFIFHLKCLAFSPAGDRIVAGLYQAVMVWDLNSKKLIKRLSIPREVSAVAFSPDGKTLAAAAGEATKGPDTCVVRLWDAMTGAEIKTLEGHNCGQSVAFSPDGRRLAASGVFGGGFSETRIWDPATGQELVKYGHGGQVAFAPRGSNTIAIAGSGYEPIRLGLVEERNVLAEIRGHGQTVDALAFSPDGKQLVTGARDCQVRLWDVESCQDKVRLTGHRFYVRCVAWSPDGNFIASAGGDYAVRIWDAHSFRELRFLDLLRKRGVEYSYDHNAVNAIAFSPDSKLLAAGCRDDRIYLFDVATGKRVRELKGHTNSITTLAFSPDGKMLASGALDDDGTIRLWDAADGSLLRTLPLGDKACATAVIFSRDGSTLFTAGGGFIRTWNPLTGQELMKVPGAPSSLAVSDTGLIARVTSGSNAALEVWYRSTGKLNWQLPRREAESMSLAFSPDGRTLASLGSKVLAVRLWNADTGNETRRLLGHDRMRSGSSEARWPVTALAFSPDGNKVASGGSDTTILIWDLTEPPGQTP